MQPGSFIGEICSSPQMMSVPQPQQLGAASTQPLCARLPQPSSVPFLRPSCRIHLPKLHFLGYALAIKAL
jgi:hypothetical protein